MKPTPTSLTQRATCSGVSSRLTPAASITSALPDLLDTERLPCLATLPPAAATTKAEAVEILKVCTPSPPVPQVSTRCGLPGHDQAHDLAHLVSRKVAPFDHGADGGWHVHGFTPL